MDTTLKRLNQFFLTIFAGILLWMGIAVVNHAAALAAPPGAENTPQTSLEFRHNKTSDIMRGAAQDNGTPNGVMSSQQMRDRSALDDLRQNSRDAAQRANRASDRLVNKSQNKLQDAADTVRETLNLDEPIAPETKEFMRDVKHRVDSTVSPVTGDRTGGYYSTPRQIRR